ncbi:tyrosine-type recombinase/integrase [Cryptosporangium aurantiacum]|uniref:tyrosine-type recombinase/integrase n=1 Tax=Cryptosporangium aurantiacum TaxID=134849 RepID=UPI000A05C5F1
MGSPAIGKTRKSRRTLALPQRCVDALERQKVQQDADREAAGADWVENSLVFASKVGTPLDPSHVRRDFRNAIKDAPGVTAAEWTPRELRHSFVSLLSDRGGLTLVCRQQIRPVVQGGAVAMDRIFKQDDPGEPEGDPAA